MERDLFENLSTRNRLSRHPGYYYFKKTLLVLKGAHNIFHKNYFDWKRFCDEFRNVDDDIRFNDAWRWRKQKAIVRSFHNLIVSFCSYIEHIEGLKHPFSKDTSLANNVRDKLRGFKNDERTAFITLLRNMMVHQQVHPLVSKGVGVKNKSNGRNEINRFQSIRREEVESYIDSPGHQKSKNAAKPFLKKQPEGINIELILKDYLDALESFHCEIVFAVISTFESDLILFRDNVSEYLKSTPKANFPINGLQLRYLQFLLHCYSKHTESL